MIKTTYKIELFVAGCSICQEVIHQVIKIAGSCSEISISNINDKIVAEKVEELGIKSIPAVFVDGELVNCCFNGVFKEELFRPAVRSCS